MSVKVPSGTNWPAGFESSRWDDGQFYYWLRRQRPEGAKGPRKQFLNVDWWMFRFEPMEREDVQTRHLRHKAKELADIQYGMTIKGRAEINAQWKRFYKASTDERFQVFKAACGIVEEKRGRPRKKIETQQEKSE